MAVPKSQDKAQRLAKASSGAIRLTPEEAAKVKGFAKELNSRPPRKGTFDPNLGFII